ncbi:MAG: MoxR family ATPase, partial [Nitrosomonadales bacterium]|nr:MoxR family ATPase [Nitrosomonadales bacterium]
VIATQNPTHHIGTFPLPESQLDRFLMRIELGYPDGDAERNLLKNNGGRERVKDITPCVDGAGLIQLQQAVQEIHVSDALLDYLQAILQFTRSSSRYSAGLSPRAGLALRQCAQAWAMMDGRDYALPEDVQAVLPGVAKHRLQASSNLDSSGDTVEYLLNSVAVS